MTALLINANNTNTTFALANERRILRVKKVPTTAIAGIPFRPGAYDAAVLASVVPFATKRLRRWLSLKPIIVTAEIDLGIRGPGEVLGTRQHGVTDLKIASWQDIDLIKLSKTVASQAIANPAKFAKLHNRFRQKIIVEN